MIEAIVACVRPKIGETVCDPACGTGGFLLAAYECMKSQSHDKELLRKLRSHALTGVDIVDEVVRLCAMNLYLHGIGNGGSPVRQGDALAKAPGVNYDLDIFWLKDDSLEDIDALPAPDLIAAEIVENLEAALEQFRSVAAELEKG
ncbi:HsdM family class I SAM-dependent methyltransferase [Candidatus Chloroploca mongolica]|uniref:HsdM family class I SAM-dependent methyltransferase n=1 Tax=Candidatus Chloroploca mongolica TaxID=2528176 RepID=UPI003531645D